MRKNPADTKSGEEGRGGSTADAGEVARGKDYGDTDRILQPMEVMAEQWTRQCVCSRRLCLGFLRNLKPRGKHLEMLLPELVSWKTQDL